MTLICYKCGIPRNIRNFPKQVMGEYKELGKKKVAAIGNICKCCVRKGR